MAVLRRFFPRFLSAFSVVLMIAVWLAFAPTQAGGFASYIVVIGNSMEPRFHIGDLIIAHEESSYHVGDAIVYRNAEMENFVFHRIIAQELDRYILQGDNNSWVDTYQPSKEEVLGKLWLHIPHGGLAIQKIRSPWIMALVAAVLGMVLANNLFSSKAKGNRSMNDKSAHEWFFSILQRSRTWFAKNNRAEPQRSSVFEQGEMVEGSFFVLGLIVLSSLILGIISFSRPTSRIEPDDIQYQHLGVFSYLASAPPGVYDQNAIQSGDPIFPRLTCVVDINLQYTLIAQYAKNITGTYQLTAVIREPLSGWERTVPLQEATAFSGPSFGTTAKLDLCEMESLTQSMEQETNFHPGSYTLSIIPNIKLTGQLAGRTLDGTFNSGLTFVYDRVHFYLFQNEEVESLLSLTETQILHAQNNVVNTIAFLGGKIAVPVLRWVALIGLIVSVAGLLYIALKLQTLSRSDQSHFFRLKYSSLILDVQPDDEFGSENAIDVVSLDALAKLAERFHGMILHVREQSSHSYYVQAGGTTYRYEVMDRLAESSVPQDETVHQGGAS